MECMGHSDCSTGACYSGVCVEPSREHEHCSPSNDQCSNVGKDFTCSAFSKTCVKEGFKPNHSYCYSDSDCSASHFCEYGKCALKGSPNHSCEFFYTKADNCEDGYGCSKPDEGLSSGEAKCRKLCSPVKGSPFGCGLGESCEKAHGKSYNVCMPKKITESATPTPLPPVVDMPSSSYPSSYTSGGSSGNYVSYSSHSSSSSSSFRIFPVVIYASVAVVCLAIIIGIISCCTRRGKRKPLGAIDTFSHAEHNSPSSSSFDPQASVPYPNHIAPAYVSTAQYPGAVESSMYGSGSHPAGMMAPPAADPYAQGPYGANAPVAASAPSFNSFPAAGPSTASFAAPYDATMSSQQMRQSYDSTNQAALPNYQDISFSYAAPPTNFKEKH